MAGGPMRLSLAITADASGVAPATAEVRREIEGVSEASRRQSAANDQAAAAARRATEALRGQSAAERDLRAAVASFAGIRSPMNDNEYRQRAADVAAYGNALDRLRAQYNPLFAVTRSYLQSRAEIQQAHKVGAISANEMAEALGRERQAALASIAAIKGRNAALSDTPVRGGGASSFNTANIAAQFQDIGVTSAMGMSPVQIALQQGTQLSAVFEQMRSQGQGVGATLGAAFASVISPVSLLTIGVVGLTAAAAQYAMTLLDGTDDSEEALSAQIDLIKAVADRWGDALPAIKAYADEQERIAGRQQVDDATAVLVEDAWKKARAAIDDAKVSVADIVVSIGNIDHDAVVELQGAFNTLTGNVAAGKTDTEDLERVSRALSDLYERTQIPIVKELADQFSTLAGEIEKANTAATLAIAEKNLLDLQKNLPALGTIPSVYSGGGSFLDADGVQTARANATKSQFEREQERLARRIGSQTSAYDRAIGSADDRIAQMRTEIELLGRVGAEAEALRYEQELLNRATDEGKTLDEKQIAAIREKAEEYGRLKSELAATRLEQDLMFERDQMFRSPTEQRVASTLRSAGVDAASERGQAIADQIRLNEQLAISRDLSLDFASSFVNDLANGVSVLDALTNALGRVADQLIDMAMNQLITSLFSNLLGSVGGGMFPSAPSGLGLESGIGLFDSGGTILGGNIIPFGSKTKRLGNGAVLADSGFGSRHFKAVLEEGETVLTRQDTNRAMNVMAGGVAAAQGGGTTRVLVELTPGLIASILEQAGQQAVQVVQSNEQARDDYWRAGGEPR